MSVWWKRATPACKESFDECPSSYCSRRSRGIGRATARTLHRAGFRLILNGRSTAELQTLEAELPGSFAVAVDLLEAETPARLVRAALDRFGRLDAQVNAAGYGEDGAATGDRSRHLAELF
jgi:NADP-dependent 3-hydroxy acid dehydrogenase YdfG